MHMGSQHRNPDVSRDCLVSVISSKIKWKWSRSAQASVLNKDHLVSYMDMHLI